MSLHISTSSTPAVTEETATRIGLLGSIGPAIALVALAVVAANLLLLPVLTA